MLLVQNTCMTIDHVFTLMILIIYSFLLIFTWKYAKATEKLVKVTNEYSAHTEKLVEQQNAVAEMNIMPQIHIDFWHPSKMIRIKVKRSIAEIIDGEIVFKKDQLLSNDIVIEKINPSTAMPWHGGEITIATVHIEDKLEKLDTGDKVTIQVNLKYKSVLGGLYKSSHWIELEKSETEENPFKQISSGMKYEEKPWQKSE
jgi:hypothetical protein